MSALIAYIQRKHLEAMCRYGINMGGGVRLHGPLPDGIETFDQLLDYVEEEVLWPLPGLDHEGKEVK